MTGFDFRCAGIALCVIGGAVGVTLCTLSSAAFIEPFNPSRIVADLITAVGLWLYLASDQLAADFAKGDEQ